MAQLSATHAFVNHQVTLNLKQRKLLLLNLPQHSNANLGWCTAQPASKNLKKLKDGIETITKGNLDYQLEEKSNDEFGDLARGFNLMTGELKKSKQEVEGKVAERTKQLQELNNHMVGRELRMKEMKEKLKKMEGENQV